MNRTIRPKVGHALVALLFISGCKSEEAAPPRTDIAAPSPPSAGSIEMTVSGAAKESITGEGIRCATRGSFDATAKGKIGTSDRSWRLTAMGPRTVVAGTKEEQRPADFRVSLGKNNYVWDAKANLGSLTFTATSVKFDTPLTLWKSTGTIRVVGELKCPSRRLDRPIHPEIVAMLGSLSGAKVRGYATYEFGRSKDQRAISVVVPERRAQRLVDALRQRLGTGWSAWQGTTRFVDEARGYGVEVVVGPVVKPADILRVAHVDPVNYGLLTQDVVVKIAEWDRRFGVDIRQADVESVHLVLKRIEAKDVGPLAKDVYAFCPDVVDQGVGTVEKLEAAIRKDRQIYLWWD